MALDPSAPEAWPRFELMTLVEMVLGSMFNRLKTLNILALTSILALSPMIFMLGRPKDLVMVKSTFR